MEPITQEQQEDINIRVEEFVKRHRDNVAELEVDFVQFPQYIQIGPGMFATQSSIQPMDKRYLPKESPMQSNGSEIVEV